jgi:hypothetical protein
MFGYWKQHCLREYQSVKESISMLLQAHLKMCPCLHLHARLHFTLNLYSQCFNILATLHVNVLVLSKSVYSARTAPDSSDSCLFYL